MPILKTSFPKPLEYRVQRDLFLKNLKKFYEDTNIPGGPDGRDLCACQ
jgi:hypothetical protein